MKSKFTANRKGVAGYAPTDKHIGLPLLLTLAITILACSSDSDNGGDPNTDGGDASSSSGGGGSSSSVGGGIVHRDPVEYQGETYTTVVIGNQTWFARNLNYAVDGSKCYDNLSANCEKYGRLYTWNMAKTACPSGWHLPSKAEWDVLTVSVGGDATAGKELKATSGWNSNGNGTDEFGFTALPGGYGTSGSSFNSVGYRGNWWSASEYDASHAYNRYMEYYDERAFWSDGNKSGYVSVRCIKD